MGRLRARQLIVADCVCGGRGQQLACGLRQRSASRRWRQRLPQRRRKKLRAKEPASSTSAITATNPFRIVAVMAGCMIIFGGAAAQLQVGNAAAVCACPSAARTVAATAVLVKPAQPPGAGCYGVSQLLFKRSNFGQADCDAALNQNAVPSFNFLSTALRKWPLVRLWPLLWHENNSADADEKNIAVWHAVCQAFLKNFLQFGQSLSIYLHMYRYRYRYRYRPRYRGAPIERWI